MKIFARFSIFRQYIGKKGQYIDKKVGRRADFLPGSTTILQGSRWVVDAALSCCGRFLLLQGVTMPMPSLVAPTFSMLHYFVVTFLVLLLTEFVLVAGGSNLLWFPSARKTFIGDA